MEKYQYSVLTVTLTGDYKVIYQRFLERDASPDRHRGHVVNDCYPEKEGCDTEERQRKTLSYENFVQGIGRRGFDAFSVGGERIKVDTTDFSKIDLGEIMSQIESWKDKAILNTTHEKKILHGGYWQAEKTDMIYESATMENLQDIYDVVQRTIQTIYPKYYPAEVVAFFCELHSKEAIAKDIGTGSVGIVKADGRIVATGCFVGNHITRVYVLPEYQKRGLGTQIMKSLETRIGEAYDSVYLDASLPAAALYEKLGFHTIKHERYPVENGVVLVYEIMEKHLFSKADRYYLLN